MATVGGIDFEKFDQTVEFYRRENTKLKHQIKDIEDEH